MYPDVYLGSIRRLHEIASFSDKHWHPPASAPEATALCDELQQIEATVTANALHTSEPSVGWMTPSQPQRWNVHSRQAEAVEKRIDAIIGRLTVFADQCFVDDDMSLRRGEI